MAVHNGEPYLVEAIESVLNQSLQDFELILVDDASTDGSLATLKTWNNRRIKILKNVRKLGLARSLNKVISYAKGKYIARMDHDDIALRQRFENQVEFFEHHPKIDILGTWAKTFGSSQQIWKYPTDDAEIKAEMLFNSNLVHSSVMMRASALKRHRLSYDPKIPRAQDYELWSRAAERINFANLDQVLMLYRLHSKQAGKQHADSQQAVASRVRLRQLRALGLKPTKAQLNLHNAISIWDFPKTEKGLLEVERWLQMLLVANRRVEIYSQAALNLALEKRWLAACRGAVSLGLHTWNLYKKSEFATVQPVLWGKAFVRELGWR
jgi:glycosyltransferase involved in cell wall biosynthesis